MKTLETNIRNAKNVQKYLFGKGALRSLSTLLDQKRVTKKDSVVFFVDKYFEQPPSLIAQLSIKSNDQIYFVPTVDEPTTKDIDVYVGDLQTQGLSNICALVGIGGGITMDVAKAVANLLTNGGKAEDYQGWDLVKVPGIFKIAVPTISGTGSEATRTCVMTNKQSGLKLGMNSDHTVFDQIVLDPDLTRTVPRDQYFWTGMDAYIHCVEALAGRYRNGIGDAFSHQTLSLCRDVFLGEDMMSDQSREQLMVASYLGGCAIASSYVGVVHPFSAGLSVVLGLHHCVANCIAMRAMEEFYPREFGEFWKMVKKQGVHIPEGVCRNLTEDQYQQLYASTVVHEKPLTNALGEEFKKTLTPSKVREIFMRM